MMNRGSIFNAFTRFSRAPSRTEEAVCLVPTKLREEPKFRVEDRSVREEKVERSDEVPFEKKFILLLNKILLNLDHGEDGDLCRILTRVHDVLVKPPVKKQSLPYFYHPKYTVESNLYQIDGSDIIIAACLSAIVPQIILYPFGRDIIADVEVTTFEMSITDSDGKAGVAEVYLNVDKDGLTSITFGKYYEIDEDGLRVECKIDRFTLPATFSGRYTLGE